MKYSCIGSPKCLKKFSYVSAQKAHQQSCPHALRLLDEKENLIKYEEFIELGRKSATNLMKEIDFENPSLNQNIKKYEIPLSSSSNKRNSTFSLYPFIASRDSIRYSLIGNSAQSNLRQSRLSSSSLNNMNTEAFRFIASRNEIKNAQSIESSTSNFSMSNYSYLTSSSQPQLNTTNNNNLPLTFLKFSSYYRRGLNSLNKLHWNDYNKY